MLVLSRKCSQGIVLKTKNGFIRVSVVRIRNGKVRLGIEAPADVSVQRDEIAAQIDGYFSEQIETPSQKD